MDEVQVDVTQTPGVVLGLGHGQCVVSAVVVVPQFGGDKDVLALHQPFLDGALDAQAGLVLVLIVVGPVEQAVALFDGL
jgi:hypothetical protein